MLKLKPKKDFNEVSVEPMFCDYIGSPELISAFNANAKTLYCARDRVLFGKGEVASKVYLVRSGGVTLMLPYSLSRAMVFRAEAGALVGLPAAFSEEPYSMTAVALKDSEFAVMSREDFLNLTSANPSLSLEVLKVLAAETRAARMAIVDAGMKRLDRG